MENLDMNISVIALRGVTAFPNTQLTFDVEREASIYALNHAMDGDRRIFLITQKEISVQYPEEKDLFTIGTVCHIEHIMKTGDASVRVLVQGESRARMHRLWQLKPFLMANIEILTDTEFKVSKKSEAMIRQTYSLISEYTDLLSDFSNEKMTAVFDETDPGHLADYIANALSLRHDDKQALLEQLVPLKRLSLLNDILAHEIEIVKLEMDIEKKVRLRVNQMQKDTVLREQMKVLQHELGDDSTDEIDTYREKILNLHLLNDVEEKLLKEVNRLSKQPFGSTESSVIRNYLDTVLDVPWNMYTKDRNDIEKTRVILNRDHYGLEKVKESIVECIAVKKLNPDAKGKIICLVGPPGVGKTSIAISIAKAMNRNLARISLGGVRDEADIRGHRKTYVGAMPGRIIEALIRSKSMNPLFVLDEIDKLSSDLHGDPASALLEVLDGEQNYAFRDHYLEIPIDLGKAMFITTANTVDTIPRPLLDRMDVIELSSYTDEEKVFIAKEYLVKKQVKNHGLTAKKIIFRESGIRKIIENYSKESGVRLLERNIGKICAKVAVDILDDPEKKVVINENNVPVFLGPERYLESLHSNTETIGVVNGLAWTERGGEILEVEVNVMPGSGKLELTGNLGNVMQESARAALSCLRSRAKDLNISESFYKDCDIHIHFPEGATPKDGPSAGIAIATAMYSAISGRKIAKNIAMTGEITIRGRVLPIGGLKEKTMAALRNHMSTVIIPSENLRDLSEIDQNVRKSLNFIGVDDIDSVFNAAVLPETKKEVVNHISIANQKINQECTYGNQFQ